MSERLPATTVDDVLRGFRPRRRTGIEGVPIAEAVGRVPPGDLRASRPVAVGAAVDVKAGEVLAPAGRALRSNDLAPLAASGLAVVPVRARPRVSIVSMADWPVPAGQAPPPPDPGQDAITPSLAAVVAGAGGVPEVRATRPEGVASLRDALGLALEQADLVTVCPLRPGPPGELAVEAIASLRGPGIWSRGLAMQPGESTLLADCGGIPIIWLPGDPLAALTVFRLIGVPLLHCLAGCTAPLPPARTRAVLSDDLPSIPGRLEVVQVRIHDGRASALPDATPVSTLGVADGYVIVPTEATGLAIGAEVEVELYR